MITCKEYLTPELEIIVIAEDVVRTSSDKGELPLQPFGSASDPSIFG